MAEASFHPDDADSGFPRSVPSWSAADLALFGLDDPREAWLDRLREAEMPARLGCIGSYEILEEVSRGGQGVVYRARQPGLRREVALKRLVAGAFASPAARRRFEREIEAASTLNHPNIVTAYATEIVDGQPVLAMEWVDGAPLTRWAARGDDGRPRAIDEVLRVFIEICDGVQHAHQRGLIHRDLKPSNILVDSGGHPRLLDFGLAKSAPRAAEGAASVTLTEHFMGTPAYASPEQAAGRPGDVDSRTDVYSLGVVLYEALTGRMPYPVSDSLVETLETVRHEVPARPLREGKPLPRELELILRKALAKAPGDRYPTVEAFAADLRAFRAGEPVSAHPPTVLYTLRSLGRRHVYAVGSVASIVIVLAAFAVVSSVLLARIDYERRQALGAAERERRARLEERGARETATAINDFLQRTLVSIDPKEAAAMRRAYAAAAVCPVAQAAIAEAESLTAPPRDDSPDDLDLTGAAVVGVAGEGRSALDVLDEASRRVGWELVGQPRVAAGVRKALSAAYFGLGYYRQAAAEAQEYLAFCRAEPGIENRDLIAALGMCCSTGLGAGAAAAAEPYALEALDLARAQWPGGDPLLADILNDVSRLRLIQGRPRDALAVLEEAVPLTRRVYGDHHAFVANVLTNLGDVHRALGDREASADAFRQALDVDKVAYGPDTHHYAMSLVSYGVALRELRDFAGTERVWLEAVEIARPLYQGPHPDLAIAIMNLGLLYEDTNRPALAAPLLREALEMNRQFFHDPDHRITLILERRLGEVLADSGAYDEAEPLMRAAHDHRMRTLGAEHDETFAVARTIGRMLGDRGDHAAAERWWRDQIALHEPRGESGVPATVASRRELGVLLTGMDRAAEAQAELGQVITYARNLGEPGLRQLGVSLCDLADAHRALQDWSGAEALYYEVFSNPGGDDADTTGAINANAARAALGLAAVCDHTHLVDEADLWFREATARVPDPRTRPGRIHGPTLADCQSEYGRFLVENERYAEAQALLEAAHDDHAARLGPRHPATARTRDRLRLLYERTGRPGLASQLSQ